MEGLRIELAREANDLVGGDLVRPMDGLVADCEVLPVLQRHSRECTTTSVFVGRVSAT